MEERSTLNDTPTSERVHIGFFGLRNAGKSSLVNRITGQDMSLVSDIKGTTTDPVKKGMELLPLGPVTIIDTPGYDDEGELGGLRVKRTGEVLKTCDIAVVVTENQDPSPVEKELLGLIRQRNIPCFIAVNKSDKRAYPDVAADESKSDDTDAGDAGTAKAAGSFEPVGATCAGAVWDDAATVFVSALTGEGVHELKEKLANALKGQGKQVRLVADLISPKDIVVLVIPIDTSAPKGRLILPQQLAIRDILDAGAVSVISGVEDLGDTLSALKEDPALVITDSQAFGKVMKIVKADIPLTSFSILMARYKGFLDEALKGVRAIDSLPEGARILISEGCTHHRQCGDIGTVKIPDLLKKHTGRQFDLSFSSGHGFPEDLSGYDLVIHCGGCMLNDNEMQNRMNTAVRQGVPFTNYGMVIAHMNGILERSTAPVI
ncbi:MAG: [FeFe] hydrogenase H-cluster maturation GTPase HydF [Lachnospiraceae bacterium]|nr:[FeFe] hydrogenase H-cluster maturation GTPase HydF [Lachnospiraceae bacterium]